MVYYKSAVLAKSLGSVVKLFSPQYECDDPGIFWTVDSSIVHNALAIAGAPIPQGTCVTVTAHAMCAHTWGLLRLLLCTFFTRDTYIINPQHTCTITSPKAAFK